MRGHIKYEPDYKRDVNKDHYYDSSHYEAVVYTARDESGHLLFENSKDMMRLIEINAPTNEAEDRLVARFIMIARITRKSITFSNDDFKKLFAGCNIKAKENFYYPIIPDIVSFLKIGMLPLGKSNTITDVPGVSVGHYTVSADGINTGITVVIPCRENVFRNKLFAGSYVFNGFGKPLGLTQVDELGMIETPIILTNTLSVGIAADGLISYMLKQNPEIGEKTGTVNPLVLECNDGYLNNIRHMALTGVNVNEAIQKAGVSFTQGSVGAGTGMRCLGYKGGIGSASRIIMAEDRPYVLGVLVNSNFQGSTSGELKIKGRYITGGNNKENDDLGSIVVVIATNLPLNSLQLKRLAKRAEIGIGNTGGYAGHGSGDIIIAFSTANVYNHFPENCFREYTFLHDNYLNNAFRAVCEATEEAILNSMLYAAPVVGYKNREVRPLSYDTKLFDYLLREDIKYV